MSCSLMTARSPTSKPEFEAPDSDRHLVARIGHRLVEFRDRFGLAQIVILKHMREALARALRPRAEDHPHLLSLQVADVPDRRLEDVGVLVCPLGDEIAAASRLAIDDDPTALLRHRERRQSSQREVARPLGPLLGGEIERVGRQRPVGGDAGLLLAHRFPPRVVIILHLRQPFTRRVVDHAVEQDRNVGNIVEERVEPVVEERQPMLDVPDSGGPR